LLIPPGLATCVATAIPRPPANTVRTTPGTAFTKLAETDLYLKFWRMTIQIFAVVSDPKSRSFRFDFKSVRETQITKLEMMPICFAISRDVHQISGLPDFNETINQAAT
jgi:hypothetical protein